MEINPISTNYTSFCFSSQELDMIRSLKADPCWEDDPDCAPERLVNESLPYVVSQGADEHLFNICYLNADRAIIKAAFTLEQGKGQWFFRNGFETRSSDFKDVIDYIMQPH